MEDVMKTRRLITLAGLAFAVALLALPAAAQSLMLQADVPFAFTANNVAMDSGRCVIKRVADSSMVSLTDPQNQRATTMLILDDIRQAQDAKLIFERYGEHYVLVRIETQSASYKLPTGRRQSELAHTGAPQQIAVLASALMPAR
jgi:hypothetical protein